MKNLLLLLFITICCISGVHADETEFLPSKNLYSVPIADPRWPKFSIGLSKDFKGNLGKSIWNFTFGENIGLVQHDTKNGKYEFGVQAATFGLMDIHSNPTRLINSDYFIGFGLSYASDNIEQLLQLSHLSSHVGDEFLLSKDGVALKRVNLSYETLKWYVRYKNLSKGFSPYAAIGYMIHVDPHHMKRLTLDLGFDYLSRKIIFNNTMRWIAGAHLNSWAYNRYKSTLNLRVGLQYEKTKYCDRCLQLLLEYKNGKSQEGQFYHKNVHSVGIILAFSS